MATDPLAVQPPLPASGQHRAAGRAGWSRASVRRLLTRSTAGMEVACPALLALSFLAADHRPAWQQPLLVAGAVAAGLAFVLNFAGLPGLLRRLHDCVFDSEAGTTVRYVFLLRFHLLVGVLLTAFPYLAVHRFRRLLDTLFFVRPVDLMFVTWMALLNSWALLVGMQLTCRYGYLRFGGDPLRLREPCRTILDRLKLGLAGLLAVPTVWYCIHYLDQPWLGGCYALIGAVAALGTLVTTTWQRESLVPRDVPPSSLLLPGVWFRRRNTGTAAADDPNEPVDAGFILPALLRWFGPGYYDAQRDHCLPGHLLAATVLGAVLCVYGLIGFAFRPQGGWNDWFPPLGYVLNVFMLAAWGLPAAAFFFDRWRIPVLMALVILCVLLYSLSHTDHYYSTLRAEADLVARAVSLTPQEALDAWVGARQEADQADRLTVVVLSGGGIAAAAWGAEVLTGLEAEMGTPFVRSLHALSSASGGSVGVMYYLDDFQPTQPRTAEQLARIRNAASHSSLAALTWGVAYPDIWRFLVPPVMRFLPHLDRGWALQEAWREQLVDGPASLFSWRAKVAEGQMPVALLDATGVDSGRQFVMTPADIHRAGGRRFQASLSFLGEYDGRDLDIATAARLSATFPWVSPITRAARESGGPDWHIADGAYFDNYGMVSMIEWLNSILPRYTELRARPKVLLIRISIRDTSLTIDKVYDEKEGWAYTVYGPLLTLLTTGSTSQLARNDQLLRLLADRWTTRGDIDLTVANFVLRTEVPLSWQLTASARGQIRARWAEEVERGRQLERVREFFRDELPGQASRATAQATRTR